MTKPVQAINRYKADLREMSFLLFEQFKVGDVLGKAPFEAWGEDEVKTTLGEVYRWVKEVTGPLNVVGDMQGCKLEGGRVVTPTGFKDAWNKLYEAGWNSIGVSPEYGGAGSPAAVQVLVLELLAGSNPAFAMYPGLAHGAAEVIQHFGTPEQKALFCERMYSGKWGGTMCLTEPHAGTDVGSAKTTAKRNADGSYSITGTKIFISAGEHDLTENIIHLVLARLPDAPPGTRGLTLFVAPKRLVNDDGSLGAANAVRPGSIEHKLGIHASPTCVMLFEGAKAEMVSAPNQGLAAMFVMMNDARLQVGVQGVAIAERAYQQALAYALERKQGRSAWTGSTPSRLFDHPDVRRSLMLMKAKISAARAICLSTAVASDLARTAGNPVDRDSARFRQELLTPIAKAWSTDIGVEVASMGLQIHGGMGFIEETGAAQHYRDARILPIYEGTNGIQAIDLMGRKLALNKGQAVRELVADIFPTAAALKSADDAWLHTIGAHLETGLAAVQAATGWLIERRGHAQPDALAGATPYLKLLGDVVGGWMLGKEALAASAKIAAGEGPQDYYRTKIGLARVFAEQILAQAPGLTQAVTQGSVDLFRATPEALGA